MIRILPLLALFLVTTARAEYPLDIQKVSDNVYALVGELAQRSPDNYANNSTHGVIITPDGVILVDPGGSYRGARQIHEAIQTLTDKPVKIVINTGGQDHRWLGNGYFKERGAHIIASEAAKADHHARTNNHFNRLTDLIGDALKGTEAVYPDETFAESKDLEFGGVKLEMRHVGPAHTPGDIFIWMPAQKIMFTGDIVYVERALGTGPANNVSSWITVYETMAAYKPEHIIPGHGSATDLQTANRDTYAYLNFLMDSVQALIDDGGEMQDTGKIDDSAFGHLKVLDQIGGRNLQAVFGQLEFQ